MNRSPVELGETAVTLLLADRGKELCFQRCVGQFGRQWPDQPGAGEPLQRQPDSRWRHTNPAGNLVAGHPGGFQPKHVAHLAHRDPLCWHRPLPWQKPKERTLSGPAETPSNRATSSRNGGRNHLGTPSDIKSEWWATSSRIRGRLPPESAFEADLPPEIYAYRAGRNAQQAVVDVEELLFRGHPDVVDADLADYFGSIPH